jgi:hypothetical protein
MVIGQEKGRAVKDKVYRNFGMPKPEGYRKALRLMELAERFSMPVITLIDTPGAYPGIDSEERGISESIATNLAVMSRLRTPILSVVIGEGSSGGALGIGVGDHLAMLQYATYFVISPEGCANIIWKSTEHAADAAAAMGVTSEKLQELGIVDATIERAARRRPPRPGADGGAHSRAPRQSSWRAAARPQWRNCWRPATSGCSPTATESTPPWLRDRRLRDRRLRDLSRVRAQDRRQAGALDRTWRLAMNPDRCPVMTALEAHAATLVSAPTRSPWVQRWPRFQRAAGLSTRLRLPGGRLRRRACRSRPARRRGSRWRTSTVRSAAVTSAVWRSWQRRA